jgi:peptide subunit release factor 1 (eRF1)
MIDSSLIQSLPKLPPPILTAYLDSNPAKPRNQRHPSGARIYLKSRGKILAARAPRDQQKLFREQLERVDQFLRTRPEQERGIVIFSGPQAWHVLRLQVDVEDELHWGNPSLTQLLWLLDEHQPSGLVLVDRTGARFFKFWLGEAEEQRSVSFNIDTSRWRRKDLVPPSHPGNQKTRGSQRDVFEQRVEAQYARFFRDAATRIRDWAEREKLSPVLLAGPNETVEPVWGELPRNFEARAGVVKGDFSRLTLAELQERFAQEIQKWRRAHELRDVESLLAQANGQRAVAGLDDTLRKLQQGAVRTLVVVRGLGGKLRQCARCGWADRSVDPACPTCGGERRIVPLRAAIPELARKYSVPVEVCSGEAGTRLRASGGLAAWLR